MVAIIRQESRFETGAASSAGAQGLMQVMPGTAQSIAGQLGWQDFQPQQAYWPYVNVALGTFYIHQWLEHFGGSIFTALAAYNGGPGNAAVWHAWAPDDDELMAALININETRAYIQAVWVNYEAYRRLYPDVKAQFPGPPARESCSDRYQIWRRNRRFGLRCPVPAPQASIVCRNQINAR